MTQGLIKGGSLTCVTDRSSWFLHDTGHGGGVAQRQVASTSPPLGEVA